MTKPFDPTKPVQTRDGRPARIIATGVKSRDPSMSVVAILTEPDGMETLHTFNKNGFWSRDQFLPEIDLINIPEKREVWLNKYSDGGMSTHITRNDADEQAKLVERYQIKRTSRTKHTFEEGQFDE